MVPSAEAECMATVEDSIKSRKLASAGPIANGPSWTLDGKDASRFAAAPFFDRSVAAAECPLDGFEVRSPNMEASRWMRQSSSSHPYFTPVENRSRHSFWSCELMASLVEPYSSQCVTTKFSQTHTIDSN